MLRNRVMRHWAVGAVALVSLGSLFLAGCGEQDLYKPPKSPYQVVGRVHLPGAAEDVSTLGEYAYLAGGEAGLVVVNVTNPAAPQVVGIGNTPKYAVAVRVASTPSLGGVYDYAFVADGTEGIDIFDVGIPSNPIAVNPFGSPAMDTFDATDLCIVLPDDPSLPFSVYVADSWRGLWRLDSTPNAPGSLFMSGRQYTNGSAEGVAVKDGFAYVADNETGVTILDARIPVAMQVVGSCDTDGFARGLTQEGNYIYVADGKNGLVVMRIQQPDSLTIAGHLPLSGDCRAVAVRENYAFVAAQDGGVHIIDISAPSNPRLAGTVVTTYATGVDVTPAGTVVVSDRENELIVLSGPFRFADNTPPANVVDLTATPRSSTSIQLEWHAPGNDLYYGTASRYDIRYASAAITDSTWATATPVASPPSPSRQGTLERFLISGLTPETEYFFALRTADEKPHWSGMSNGASAVTFGSNIPPSLRNGSVAPIGAAAGSEFTFEVTYEDPDNDTPTKSDLIVGDQTYPMTGQGQDYTAGVVFRATATLAAGSYQYHFVFDDGQAHTVSTEPAAGPWAGEIFIMGSPETEFGRDADEKQHLVLMQFNIRMSDHEVTQAEFERLIHRNPSRFVGVNRPVENVTWFDAIEYCNALSADSSLTPVYTVVGDSVAWNRDANGFRLPTEAEWERAARAGTTTALPTGELTVEACLDAARNPDPVLDPLGWYCGNVTAAGHDNSTHDVKTKQPNADGLYDMHGNVWEWCWDWYSVEGIVGEIGGPGQGVQRVIRGGSWYYFARDCRSAARGPYWPNSKDDTVGFRVCRTVQ